MLTFRFFVCLKEGQARGPVYIIEPRPETEVFSWLSIERLVRGSERHELMK